MPGASSATQVWKDAVTDIRLMLSFRSHPKVKKLRLKLGEAGPLGFIYLLMHAAELKPDGVLEGMDRDDIALAADYRGDVAEFVDTLLALRLVDFDGETYSIHDYVEHQPWVAKSPERKEKAKKAADKRWGNEPDATTNNQQLSKNIDATSMQSACGEHDQALLNDDFSNAPFLTLPILTSPSPLKVNKADGEDPPTQHGGGSEFDYSNWHPDEVTLNRIRMNDPGITREFVEHVRLEFITFAEDSRIAPTYMRSRFISRCHKLWIEAQARETNTGPLRKAMPSDLRKVPDDQLEAWSLARDGPKPAIGEGYPEYRERIALHLKNREQDGTSSFLQATATALTIN